MPQPLRATRTSTPAVPTPSERGSGLMVMALRAAEQHVLVVVGEADLHTAGQLRTALVDMLPVHPPSVLVELGALEFCDLAGLDALRDAARAAHNVGVALTFRGMSAQLAWLHHTFPPRSVSPPPSMPDAFQPVPETPAAAAQATPTTAPTAGQTSGHNATPPRTPTTPRTPPSTFASRPGCTAAAQRPASRSADLTAGNLLAGAHRRTDVPSEYLTGRARGRRGAPDGLVHAVPISDTTRSAVCGARTWPATTSWTGAAPGTCPDCAAAVAVGTVHPFPVSRTAAGTHPQSQHQPPARQVS
ncbi:MAG: STAS domain-containing protein [Actinobacteria bacterium]|nr:STAS domain-containing protein [Actinomycetota bacterium]